MSEKKEEIIKAIGEALPSMEENKRAYLMGYLEGFAANVGTAQLTVARPVA